LGQATAAVRTRTLRGTRPASLGWRSSGSRMTCVPPSIRRGNGNAKERTAARPARHAREGLPSHPHSSSGSARPATPPPGPRGPCRRRTSSETNPASVLFGGPGIPSVQNYSTARAHRGTATRNATASKHLRRNAFNIPPVARRSAAETRNSQRERPQICWADARSALAAAGPRNVPPCRSRSPVHVWPAPASEPRN